MTEAQVLLIISQLLFLIGSEILLLNCHPITACLGPLKCCGSLYLQKQLLLEFSNC